MSEQQATSEQLISLLENLNLERFTGCINLGHPGQIWLIEGEVVRASWWGHSGLPALVTLLLMPEVSYQLLDERPAPGPTIISTTALKTMQSHVQRDWRRLSPLVLKAVEGAPPGPSLGSRTVMTLLDGRCTLAEAVLEADIPPAAVIHHVAGCVDSGHLMVVGGPHPLRASPSWLSEPENTLDPDSHEPDSTAEVIYSVEVPMPQSAWVQEIKERHTEEMMSPVYQAPQQTDEARPGQARYIIANIVAAVLFVVAALSLIWVFLAYRPFF